MFFHLERLYRSMNVASNLLFGCGSIVAIHTSSSFLVLQKDPCWGAHRDPEV